MGNTALTIPGAVDENNPSSGDALCTIIGRSTNGLPSACPSQVYLNTSSIYAIEQNIDLNQPIPNPAVPTSYQIVCAGTRYYGWVAPDMVVAADSRGCLCLGDSGAFSSQTTYLSQAFVTSIGNMNKVFFAYKGSIAEFSDTTGIFAKLTPEPSASTWQYACLPLYVSTLGQQLYLTTDAGYDAASGNPYFLHPSLIIVAPPGATSVLGPEFGMVPSSTLQNNTAVNIALGAAATSALSNPFQDPTNPAVNVMFNGPTGVTSTPSTTTNINITFGSATYSLEFPYYFWVLIAFGFIIIILLIVMFIVVRKKEIKYKPTPRTKMTAQVGGAPAKTGAARSGMASTAQRQTVAGQRQAPPLR